MAIDVAPDLEAAIRRKVASGRYRDGEAVIRAALRWLEIGELRESIEAADAEIERGEGQELTPALWDEIEREAEELVRLGRQPKPDVCP